MIIRTKSLIMGRFGPAPALVRILWLAPRSYVWVRDKNIRLSAFRMPHFRRFYGLISFFVLLLSVGTKRREEELMQ